MPGVTVPNPYVAGRKMSLPATKPGSLAGYPVDYMPETSAALEYRFVRANIQRIIDGNY
jgi:hypothetical protein